MPLHLLVKWGRWFLQIVDINVGNFNMKLTGRWFPQIVDRDSGNLYPIYIYNKNCGVSFWTCSREISGDRVALLWCKTSDWWNNLCLKIWGDIPDSHTFYYDRDWSEYKRLFYANDIISLLVDFSCELGQIMTRYDILWARRVILSNVRTDSNFT